ncbi:GTPase HflX [Helcococcus ovis]|uniref:GTPase HflX n=1 Tax=Helcococcus ovis TaxID=72026 RepID=UPI0038B7E0F7
MKKEKVIIVDVNLNNKYTESQLESRIFELKELVRASNSEFVASVVQNLKEINSKYYIGSGKAQELAEMVQNLEIDTVIFNNELTGSQMKNLEDVINKKIVDRTGLILDIFATRARTNESKLQIKLAQLEYRLPRLVGFRNYLSREGAGIGTRGPGEQKLEIDRRSVQMEINSIKNKLKNIENKRIVEKRKRLNSSIPIVSLIGYSNAGKSTLLNTISEKYAENVKKVYSDDLLFATLDTSARKIKLLNGKDIIITDTVGFISDLPTKLVESFKSTLEEVRDSNLVLIVVDASNYDYEIQIKATEDILADMDLIGKNILYVFNKMDKNPDFRFYKKVDNEIYISAMDENDIERLIKKIENLLFGDYSIYEVFVSYSDYDKIKKLVPFSLKKDEKFEADGIKTYLLLDDNMKIKYRKFIKKEV